jgi:hypothetical protein
MVAVAAVAVCLGGNAWLIKVERLSRPLRLQAEEHADTERKELGLAEDAARIVRYAKSPAWATRGWTANDVAEWVQTEKQHRDAAGYYASLRRKYARASFTPWLSVEPDPPPPWSARDPWVRAVLESHCFDRTFGEIRQRHFDQLVREPNRSTPTALQAMWNVWIMEW